MIDMFDNSSPFFTNYHPSMQQRKYMYINLNLLSARCTKDYATFFPLMSRVSPQSPPSPRILMSDLVKVGLLGAGGFGAVELWEHKATHETYVSCWNRRGGWRNGWKGMVLWCLGQVENLEYGENLMRIVHAWWWILNLFWHHIVTRSYLIFTWLVHKYINTGVISYIYSGGFPVVVLIRHHPSLEQKIRESSNSL